MLPQGPRPHQGLGAGSKSLRAGSRTWERAPTRTGRPSSSDNRRCWRPGGRASRSTRPLRGGQSSRRTWKTPSSGLQHGRKLRTQRMGGCRRGEEGRRRRSFRPHIWKEVGSPPVRTSAHRMTNLFAFCGCNQTWQLFPTISRHDKYKSSVWRRQSCQSFPAAAAAAGLPAMGWAASGSLALPSSSGSRAMATMPISTPFSLMRILSHRCGQGAVFPDAAGRQHCTN
mmetsp:Transcript_36374/g.102759  ORF Transcript_36374/g.102759 Transcript_36374/m.102759 type:complete len:227 (-) Transcript_36374:63-743(-)